MNLELIKNCIKLTHAIVDSGTGKFPCHGGWEDSKHSANAQLLRFMVLNGYDQDGIMTELDVTMSEYKPIHKVFITGGERFERKTDLIKKRYEFAGGNLDSLV